MTPTEPRGGPPHRYQARLANEIETRWQAHWEREGTYRQPNPGEAGFDGSRPKFYCLDMFPYPSGAGLHVGHPEGYTATDIFSRYRRMRGFHVLHPMGWDAFGLPAEQFAIQTGVHPEVTTKRAIDTFRGQLKRFGFSYDWSREFGTIDPDYYRWTQWIFLRIYDSWYDGRARPIGELVEECEAGRIGVGPGLAAVRLPGAGARRWQDLSERERRDFVDAQRLAYVGEPTVNWCPKLGTALANEEVIDGRSERGGFPVVRRPLRQWLFRITAYADRLLSDLAGLDWPASTKTMQAEWIGRSEGAEIDFRLEKEFGTLRVYTTRPDTIFGATFMAVAPEHPLVSRVPPAPSLSAFLEAVRRRSDVERQETKQKSGVFLGLHATNPATGARIPVWTADYVMMGYGHGAIMAVPGHDERDHEFATANGLAIVRVVRPADGAAPEGCFSGEGVSVSSRNTEVSLDGLPTVEAKRKIVDWLRTRALGRASVTYKLRDWLFSRQRYWGEPFPIVWDEEGRHHPVDEAALPVLLPPMADYAPEESDDPRPLLAKARGWIHTTAGEAGVSALPPDAPVRRESNTMPGWAGSCWYYLRYCDPRNAARFVGRSAESYWMGARGVDLYVGGAEHAVLHLLYARFWHKVLYDLGAVSSPEPFQRLFHQGLVTSHAYQRADRSLVAVDAVEERDGAFFESATGDAVEQVVAKMSKSLKNVVNPDDVIADYGADTFRLYEMYMGPLEESKPWDTRAIGGLHRFLQRAWRMAVDEESGALRPPPEEADAALERLLHRTIAKVGADLERLAFNTAIASMIEFVNAALAEGVTRDQLDRFVRILSPFAPHFGEEIWHKLGHRRSVALAEWPTHEESMLREESVEIAVQILGKVKSRITVPADATDAALEKAALGDPKIRDLLAGRSVRKVIVVKGRLVNLVVS